MRISEHVADWCCVYIGLRRKKGSSFHYSSHRNLKPVVDCRKKHGDSRDQKSNYSSVPILEHHDYDCATVLKFHDPQRPHPMASLVWSLFYDPVPGKKGPLRAGALFQMLMRHVRQVKSTFVTCRLNTLRGEMYLYNLRNAKRHLQCRAHSLVRKR